MTDISQDICDESAAIRKITVDIGEPIEPPAKTIAVIVDLTTTRGAVRFYVLGFDSLLNRDKATDLQIDGVYMENPRQTLIPWNNKWSFRVSGSPRIAYIEKAREDNTVT